MHPVNILRRELIERVDGAEPAAVATITVSVVRGRSSNRMLGRW
jgi:hypothetical protein